MIGPDGPGNDVIISFREFKRMGLEDEVVSEGEKVGFGLGFESGELDSAETTGLPVVAVGRDFNGEDGVSAELVFQEL